MTKKKYYSDHGFSLFIIGSMVQVVQGQVNASSLNVKVTAKKGETLQGAVVEIIWSTKPYALVTGEAGRVHFEDLMGNTYDRRVVAAV